MKKLLLLLLAGCSSAPDDGLPADAERPRPPAAPPRAPEPPVERLDLPGALGLAERIHPELARARARIEAAEGRALQAGLLPNPSLVGKIESAPFEGDTLGDAELLAGVSQRIPAGGRLGAAREAERLEGERLRREGDLKRLEIRGAVQGAFATALFAAEAARVQAGTLDLAKRAVALARARRAAGDLAADELARAEMEEARVRLEADKAHGLRELAFVGLAAAVGDPALRIGAVDGALETALELPGIESVLASLEDGPQAGLARADLEAARARVDAVALERIPDVTLDLFYRRIGAADANAFDVGVSVPLPLFDRQQGRLAAARAEEREALERARSIRGDAVRRVREAHVRLGEAIGHARIVKDEILPRADTVLRTAEARHAAGDLSLADLLPIRREHAAARLAQLEAWREVMEAWGELRLFLKP